VKASRTKYAIRNDLAEEHKDALLKDSVLDSALPVDVWMAGVLVTVTAADCCGG
jgi:hypothetical protein